MNDVATTFTSMSLDSIKRFVAGIGENGKSTTIIDDVVRNLQPNPHYPGVSAATLWREGAHFDASDHRDGLETYDRLPKGGAQFFLVRIEPGVSVPLHATKSVDLHFVLSGELTCILEDSEFTVRAGQVMIHRGGMHGWENRGTVPYISVATLKSNLPED